MSTLNALQSQRLAFKKEGNTKLATLLSTVLGDFQNRMSREKAGDEEAEIQAVLRYFLKNIKDFKSSLETTQAGKEDPRYQDLVAEQAAIENLLPKQLTEAELSALIDSLIATHGLSGSKDKGKAMAALKDSHAGLYDGKTASQIVSQKLS